MSLSKLRKIDRGSVVDGGIFMIHTDMPNGLYLQSEGDSHDSPCDVDLEREINQLRAERQLVEEECEQLLATARRMADETIRQAEEKAHSVLEEAARTGREHGYQEGFLEGRKQADEALEKELQTLAMWAERIRERQRDWVHGLKDNLTLVVMECVRNLIGRELRLEPFAVSQTVSDLLQYVIESSQVEVRVHPSEFMAATEAEPVWQSAKLGSWSLTVVPDPNVEAGGCEIRSEFGRVDATIGTKLELLKSALADVFEREVTLDAISISESPSD